jgi:hypothetical protein
LVLSQSFSGWAIITHFRNRKLGYGVSYRDLEALFEERGVKVDHSTLNRWVISYSSSLALEAKKRKRCDIFIPHRIAFRQSSLSIKPLNRGFFCIQPSLCRFLYLPARKNLQKNDSFPLAFS